MPATKITKYESIRRRFNGLLDFCRASNRTTHEKINSSLGMSGCTYYRRRRNPDEFTVGELRLLAKVLKIPLEVLFCSYTDSGCINLSVGEWMDNQNV